MRTPDTRRRLSRAMILTLVSLVWAAGPLGCGDDDGRHNIDWDLSTTRSSRGIGWNGDPDDPDRFRDSDVRRVRIRLPGGLLIEERDPEMLVAEREQDEITSFWLQFPEETAEAAHQRAVALAQRYRLDIGFESFDTFLARALRRRAAGRAEFDAVEDRDLVGSGASATNRRPGSLSAEDPQVAVRIPYTGSGLRAWAVWLEVTFTPRPG